MGRRYDCTGQATVPTQIARDSSRGLNDGPDPRPSLGSSSPPNRVVRGRALPSPRSADHRNPASNH
jgi:hypothetical protein